MVEEQRGVLDRTRKATEAFDYSCRNAARAPHRYYPTGGLTMEPRRKKKGSEAHVRLYRHEMECSAYRTLSVGARALLVEMRALFDVKRGDNRVFLSIRDMMARCNLSQRAASRARDELLLRGWITVAERGSFHRKAKHATVFTLENEAPCNRKGSVPSKAFMRWRPKGKNTVAESATDRYAHQLLMPEKKALTLCKSPTEDSEFRPSSVVELTTQITVTKRSAA